MSEQDREMRGPHQGLPVLTAGEPLASARAAMILVHGRGATAADILLLAEELARPGFAYLAPEAAGNTWYPNSFLAPLASNEPGLSSGLALIASLLDRVSEAGIPPERVVIVGFSQGACLSLEFVARHARRYGGMIALSGGLIGPDGTPRDYPGSLAGTPVFLGCSDIDPHIPKERVLHSAGVMEALGGQVTAKLYPRMGHTINRDEILIARGIVSQII
ncbi:MAG TPA: alpha/beta hydrolase [Ktedonobacteraceae bacterium]|nr:alpha/beta hydrolase [Ktedonobacteraceae bacterium]